MLIKHKIILAFILFSGILLTLFSVYIYVVSATTLRTSFMERIKNKALATKEIYELNDKIAEKIIISIPEQSEYVFDENNKLIFSINDLKDFVFKPDFFTQAETKKEIYFNYINKATDKKDGFATVIYKNKLKRTIVITAYNKAGIETITALAFNLIVGNLIFLIAGGVAAYAFLFRTFRPVNDLVSQAESVQGHDLNFRLTYANPKDEIGIVASSFNKALSRIQVLVESQKSFISYASHELRTPLAAINGIIDTSLNYDNDHEAARQSLMAAKKEIQKATNLVNNLLQLAKIDSSNSLAKATPVNIVDVLLDTISLFKIKIPEQQFTFDIAGGHNNETDIEVIGHDQLLKTAFVNLIDNASKYSHQQKIDIHLVVDKQREIKVQIIDRGIGIPEEERQRVFEPFHRAKNAHTTDGFGIGLALTKKIFTLHGGNLKLEPNQFSGITAHVLLPVSK
ncbi:MAG: HAMP domain-containing histidine kinase [Bacteroidetes bacterium]|nr:HAMP domain-containing histidine kinase [Bacteroidota bacterium]MBS1539534.1 HAMP domain-containing histidine kinase [Bacteroidota bacterium]